MKALFLTFLLLSTSLHAANYLVQLPVGCKVDGQSTLSGACDAPVPPPSTSCVEDLPADAPGFKAHCHLDPKQTYWFNLAPGYYATAQGKWVTDYGINAEYAVTLYSSVTGQ